MSVELAPPAVAPAAPAPEPAVPPTPAAPTPAAPADQSWRERVANGDPEVLKMTGRYNSEHDFAKGFQALRTKLDSGEYKKNIPFPEKGTPEQIAEWRKESGIPESPDKYDLKFDNGLVIGDEDKPHVDKFLSKVHTANLSPDAAKTAVAAYFEMQQESQAQAVQEEREFAVQQEETLRAKWGPEYLPNKNLAEDFAVNRFGPEVGKAIMSAGPEVVEAVAAIAREINPAMTLVPNAQDPNAAIAGELEAFNKIIGTPEWYASPEKQARYQQLVNGQAQMRR